MPIDVTCPECGAGLEAPDELAGKKGTCPHCKNVLPVPGEAAPPPAAETGGAEAESAAPQEEAPPLPEAVPAGETQPGDDPSKKKFLFKCPGCGQQMAAGAHRLGTAVNCPKCKQGFKLPEAQ